MAENKCREESLFYTRDANFSGDYAGMKDKEQYCMDDVPLFALCTSECV